MSEGRRKNKYRLKCNELARLHKQKHVVVRNVIAFKKPSKQSTGEE